MKLKYLLLLLIITLIYSCEIVSIDPPEIFEEQEGTNYDIGPRAWMTIDSIEYRTCSSLPYSNTGADYYANFMLIAFKFNCKSDNQPWREVLLSLPYFDGEGEGEYELGKAVNENGWGLITYFKDDSTDDYFTSEEYRGKVNITNYTYGEGSSHKISGTYEFQAFNDSLGIIDVGNGVFTEINVTKHF